METEEQKESAPEKVVTSKDVAITVAKQFRKDLDDQLQALKIFKDNCGRGEAGRNAALAVTHLEDVIMRLGMTLKALGTENPYPNSYKPENTIVDPTADGLKM